MSSKYALISEFLTVNNGKYLVRVLIWENNQMVASGLAAAETIETAEESARKRAIAFFQENATINLPQSNSSDREIYPPLNNTINPKESPNLSPKSKPNLPDSQLSTSETKSNVSKQFKPTEELTNSDDQKSPQKQEKVVSINSAPSNMINDSQNTSTSNSQNQIKEKTKSNSINDEFENSFNIDIIMKTDIELKRLGWTKEEGTKHLLATYGKRSRHSLTDKELIEFYHYLQSRE